MKKTVLIGMAALLIIGMVLGGCGTTPYYYGGSSSAYGGGSSASGNTVADTSATTFSYTLNTYAATGRELTPLDTGSLADEMQWLAVQTACTSMYNMAQTGDFTQSDPEDWYKPNHIRTYLTKLSGSQTQNTMSYGICFNYAQAAYNDILEYQDYYEDLGNETI
jgi:hypothetical protein